MKVYTFKMVGGCVEYLHAEDGTSRAYRNGDSVVDDGSLGPQVKKRLADLVQVGGVVITETEPEGTGGPEAKPRRKEKS